MFGNAINEGQKPSRVIVRDCNMTNAKEVLEKTELPYTEGKTEVVIDRITSAAMPRQLERVPGGAQFGLNLIVNIWEQDNNEEQLMENLFKSLQLLKDDYLGGHGSRGYGQVSFKIDDVKEKTSSGYYSGGETAANSILSKYQKHIDKLHN